VNAVPPGPNRELVEAQLARVEESEQINRSERRAHKRLELVRRVFTNVPGIARALGAGRGERESVRRRHIGGSARHQQRPKPRQQVLRLVHVLDRLQEDDRVVWSPIVVFLDQGALEMEVRDPVAKPGVLERLGVRIDTDDLGRALGQQGGAVSLATGHVDDALARALLGDPSVDGEVTPEPVVLLRNIRKSALPRERERRHMWRLVALNETFGLARRFPAARLILLHIGGHGTRQSKLRAPRMASTRQTLSSAEIRDANVRYHDAAARSYDSKWAIDYGEIGGGQVVGKLEKALGDPPGHYGRMLEIGAGTGYFTLNLLRQGIVDEATATDISPGMLVALRNTAAELGLAVETVNCDAERLPFPDESFDLVLGHAVLHHVPDLPAALRECARVLSPGGTLAFMGEPSRHGDRIALLPKRFGMLAGPVWRRLVGATRRNGSAPPDPTGAERLEALVDIHTFTPDELEGLARGAGLGDVRVTGEELVANAYGWVLRTLESQVEPQSVPFGWHKFAFRSYLALQRIDGRLLEPRLPAGLFYNLLFSARKPS
jgi:SAM-dependent methyltransferase